MEVPSPLKLQDHPAFILACDGETDICYKLFQAGLAVLCFGEPGQSVTVSAELSQGTHSVEDGWCWHRDDPAGYEGDCPLLQAIQAATGFNIC